MRTEEINRITIADELRRQGLEIEMNVKEIAVYLNVTTRLIYDLIDKEHPRAHLVPQGWNDREGALF
jgi:hypothetical protein